MPSGCGRRPPDWLRSNDRLHCFEVDRAGLARTPAYGTCLRIVVSEKTAGKSRIGRSLGRRAISGQTRIGSSSTDRAFSRSGRSKPSVNQSYTETCRIRHSETRLGMADCALPSLGGAKVNHGCGSALQRGLDMSVAGTTLKSSAAQRIRPLSEVLGTCSASGSHARP